MKLSRTTTSITSFIILIVFFTLIDVCTDEENERNVNPVYPTSIPKTWVAPTLPPSPTLTILDKSTPTSAASTPVIAMSAPNPDGGHMMAGIQGTLILDGRCTYIESESGHRWIPVFPHEVARWEDGALIFKETRFEPGDFIGFGGGERSFRIPSGLAQDPPAECRTTKLWISSPNLYLEQD